MRAGSERPSGLSSDEANMGPVHRGADCLVRNSRRPSVSVTLGVKGSVLAMDNRRRTGKSDVNGTEDSS